MTIDVALGALVSYGGYEWLYANVSADCDTACTAESSTCVVNGLNSIDTQPELAGLATALNVSCVVYNSANAAFTPNVDSGDCYYGNGNSATCASSNLGSFRFCSCEAVGTYAPTGQPSGQPTSSASRRAMPKMFTFFQFLSCCFIFQ